MRSYHSARLCTPPRQKQFCALEMPSKLQGQSAAQCWECARTFPAFNSPLLSVMSVARRAAGCATITILIMTHSAMIAPRDAVTARLPLHQSGSNTFSQRVQGPSLSM